MLCVCRLLPANPGLQVLPKEDFEKVGSRTAAYPVPLLVGTDAPQVPLLGVGVHSWGQAASSQHALRHHQSTARVIKACAAPNCCACEAPAGCPPPHAVLRPADGRHAAAPAAQVRLRPGCAGLVPACTLAARFLPHGFPAPGSPFPRCSLSSSLTSCSLPRLVPPPRDELVEQAKADALAKLMKSAPPPLNHNRRPASSAR